MTALTVFLSIGSFFATIGGWFDFEKFLFVLPYAGKGWLGVFVVIIIIMICIFVMNLVSKQAAKRKAAKTSNDEDSSAQV